MFFSKPTQIATDESRKKKKKNWTLSSQQRSDSENRSAGGLSRGADGQHGLTRSWTRATGQMVADFWRPRLWSGRIQHPARLCSTQEPGLRGGCRGAPLLPRSHPLFRCSQHKSADMIAPFSPLNYPQECPGLIEGGENLFVQRCAAVRSARRHGWEGNKRVEMVAVYPDQWNSPRTGESEDGMACYFLHSLMGKSSLSL